MSASLTTFADLLAVGALARLSRRSTSRWPLLSPRTRLPPSSLLKRKPLAAVPPLLTSRPPRLSRRPKQPAAQTSPASAFLDMLRQRVQTQMAEEGDQRLREIGIGMLRSRSPNFFENLGAGLAAAEEGTRDRTERLRQAAEVERQALAQRSEEEYRREQNRLQAERLAVEGPYRAALSEQALANAALARRGGATGIGAAGRAETQRERDARLAGERAVTTENARRARAFPQEEPLTAAEAALLRDNAARRFLSAIGEAGVNLPEPPATPRITVNPSGQTAR